MTPAARAALARSLAMLLVAVMLSSGGVSGQAATPSSLDLRVTGTLLRTDRARARTTATVTLSTPARLVLRVTDFDGHTVRVLEDAKHEAGVVRRRWMGRDAAGERVAAGPYRVEATATPLDATAPTLHAETWLTVADREVYPADPSVITVVVDPGHGGEFDGAVGRDGTREADLNLDIGLRLARMLEGAGVNVVLTRDTDREANTPPTDRSSDGVVDVTDDLAARTEVANAARADLFVAVHNNMAVDRTTGGPSTYYSDVRTFRARSELLARLIQGRMVRALESVATGTWEPFDHGTLPYPYYVLRDYDPPRLQQPTRMPGVLSEGLFLSNPRELRMLQEPRVRQAMANAYYEAIAAYLARRGSQVGYDLVAAPSTVDVGGTAELEVEVRNQGSTTLEDWRLAVGLLGAGDPAVGRGRPGTQVVERRFPTLAPGERRIVRIGVPAPAEPGEWVLVIDARGPSGHRASRAGSPVLQVPLTVVDPNATPSPIASPDPSPGATPES